MKVLRTSLLATIIGILTVMTVTWSLLLSRICSSPAAANQLSHNTVAYNCHGSIVFITPFQDAALRWTWIPFILLALAGNLVLKWRA